MNPAEARGTQERKGLRTHGRAIYRNSTTTATFLQLLHHSKHKLRYEKTPSSYHVQDVVSVILVEKFVQEVSHERARSDVAPDNDVTPGKLLREKPLSTTSVAEGNREMARRVAVRTNGAAEMCSCMYCTRRGRLVRARRTFLVGLLWALSISS